VVLGTGVSYTRLPAAAVDAFSGRGVYYGAATHEAVNCTDQDVYVVGAANSAGPGGAVLPALRRQGRDRRPRRRPAAQHERVPRRAHRGRPEDRGPHLHRGRRRRRRRAPRGARPARQRTGTVERVKAGWLFVFIGAVPRTDWLGERFARDSRGFVLTGLSLLDAEGRPPPTGRSSAPPTCWSRACRASSSPATSGPRR
jgi:thioredoxin reductase (NADPH)